MKKKNVYQGSIDLKVKIIDWTNINKKVSEWVGEEVECRVGKGLIEDIEAIVDKEIGEVEIRSLIIDNECCGRTTKNHSIYSSDLNDGKPFGISIISNVEFYRATVTTERGKSIAMFPSYEVDIDIDDVKKSLTGEEVPLYQFMQGRYRYNPRIEKNEMDILKLVYYNSLAEGKKDFLSEKEMEVED
jgi:hypothetical protein